MIVEVGCFSMFTKHAFRDLLLNAGFNDRSLNLGKSFIKFRIDTNTLRFLMLPLNSEEHVPVLSYKHVKVLSILNKEAFKAFVCSDSLREFV